MNAKKKKNGMEYISRRTLLDAEFVKDGFNHPVSSLARISSLIIRVLSQRQDWRGQLLAKTSAEF